MNESRWSRYRVWKPLSLLVLTGVTPPEWEISIRDENLGTPDYSAVLSSLGRFPHDHGGEDGLDLLSGFRYTPMHSVGEQPLDQGLVPMAFQDAACGRHIPRHNPLSPHSKEIIDEI